MDIQKEREAFEKHASKFFTTNEAFENDGENYVYDEVKFMWDCWLAAKAQAVQSKQDLLDRVNARWQLAHEQCAENWNTYSSAQMDAFDWVEQDIKELLGEAQEPAND